ncbi:MAG: DUF4956 domain-containing protein [Hungatella hathewayi]|nr:DUF4956 domain-containing protein [Hungatella hathewayi]
MILHADKVTTFSDLFKKSFLKAIPQEVDPGTLVVTLLVSLALGIGIFLVYRKCFIGVVYDHSFNLSLVVMTILVSVIIVTISSNITLSLGMVGALSIVRYRTAVKNPLDLMFMFWAITTGIAAGAHYYYIALFSFLFVSVVFFILKRFKGGINTYVMIVNYDSQLECEEAVRRALKGYRNSVKSKILKNNSTELTVEIFLKYDNLNLVSIIKEIEGVHDVTLVQYRGSYEV